MNTIVIEREQAIERERNARGLLTRHAAAQDDSPTLVEGPCRVEYDDGELAAVYLPVGDVERLRAALRGTRMDEGIRSNGMATRSRTFGFHPRYTIRTTEFCAPFSLNYESPETYEVLVDLGARMADLYGELRPDLFGAQMEHLDEKVLPEWRMTGPFTSGIVNQDNTLPYHRDGGNVAASWNVMVTLRDGIDGGALSIPAFGVSLACADATVSLFDAGRITHGVTPMVKRRASGYRLSVVYFALGQMANCLSPAEELNRARIKRTEREERRAGVIE